MELEKYKNEGPNFDFKEYFTGPSKGWGIIQDWRGNIVQRFDLQMFGSWEDNEGVLQEELTFYDGTTYKREWSLVQEDDGRITGSAHDVIGGAESRKSGNAIQSKYVLELPVEGRVYKFKFDDWMWLMNDGVVINRNYMKKFGFTVAEVTIFIKKD